MNKDWKEVFRLTLVLLPSIFWFALGIPIVSNYLGLGILGCFILFILTVVLVMLFRKKLNYLVNDWVVSK